MTTIPAKNIPPWTLLALFCLLAIGLSWVGYSFYQTEKQFLLREAFEQTKIVVDFKVSQIQQWRQERLGDAQVVGGSPFLAEHLRHLTEQPYSLPCRSQFLGWLEMIRGYYRYQSVMLLSPQGKLVISVGAAPENIYPADAELIAEIIRQPRNMISDFYQTPDGRLTRLSLLAPIFEERAGKMVLQGILFCRIDAGVFLFPLIQSWPSRSVSGETLLVHREEDEVVFVNEPRHQSDARFSHRFPLSRRDLLAVQAVLGTEGTLLGLDYRGQTVLATIRAIPDTSWFLLAKVDEAEVFGQLEHYGRQTAATVLALLLAASWGGLFLWRQQQVRYLAGLAHHEAQQAKKLEGILSALPDQVLLLDRAGRCLFINQAALETFCRDRRDCCGHQVVDLDLPEEVGNMLASQITAVAAAGEPAHGEIKLAAAPETRYFDYILTPLSAGSEPAATILATFREVTEHKIIAGNLRREKDFSNTIIESLPGLFYLYDGRGKLRRWNDNFQKISGYSAAELAGRQPQDFFQGGEKDIIEKAYQQALEQGEVSVEADFICRDGKPIPYFFTGKRADLAGENSVMGMGLDLTARRQAEAALRESEVKFRHLVETANEGVFSIDRELRIAYVNQILREMTGYPSEELLGQPVEAFMFANDLADHRERLEHLLKTGEDKYERRFQRRDGTELWAIVSVRALTDARGGFAGAFGMLTDITARKQTEAQLRQQTKFSETLLETIPCPVFYKDAQGKYLGCNRAYEEVFGVSRQDIISKDVYDLWSLPMAQKYAAMDQELLRQPGHQTYEWEVKVAGGSSREVIFHKASLLDEHGNVIGLIGVLLDITDRQRAEAALRESEAQYRRLVETIPAVVAQGYADWMVDVFDDKIETLTGYPPEVFNRREMKWDALILPEDLPQVKKSFKEALKARTPYVREYRIRTKAGEVRWLQERSQFVTDVAGKFRFVSGVLFDITERRRAEEVVRESEESLRQVLAALPVGVWVTDAGGTILQANPAGEAIWAGVRYVGVEKYGEYKAWWRDTGERIKPEDWTIVRALRRGAAILNEEIEIEAFDGARKYILNSAVALKNSRGKIIKGIAVNQDITDRVRFEQRLQASLREKEVLLKEIHHRVKNNMQIISSLLRLQSGQLDLPEARTVFQESQNRIQSMALVHEMLYQSPDLAHIPLSVYVTDLVHGLYRSFQVSPEKVALHLEVADISLAVDRALPCGLILNELVSNALKYAFPDSRPGELLVRAQTNPLGELEMVVHDNGVGLPVDLDIHQTSSLGLRLVSLLVGQLKGVLALERTGGATFFITFPVMDHV